MTLALGRGSPPPHFSALTLNLRLSMAKYVLTTIFFFIARPAPAQQASAVAEINVVEEDRLVVGAPLGVPVTEAHLAVNPNNPNHLVAGVIMVRAPDMSQLDCAALTSFDGGATWVSHELGEPSCGDPWVAILPDDVVLFAVLGSEGLLVYRSADGGRTWPDTPLPMGRGHDHETMVVDETSGARNGTVYLTSVHRTERPETGTLRDAVYIARSSDAGRSWEPHSFFPFNLSFNAMTPIVLSDGMLVVSFSDYSRRGQDGGGVWLDAQRDWVATSSDGGRTFSVPLFVTGSCERTFPTLGVDRSSGPYQDRLYYLCNDGDFEHVYLHHSSDRGESWSDPVVVSKGAGRRGYVRTPAIAVNPEGVVGVSWYDGRNDRARYRGIYRCQQMFFAASLDGGETFLDEIQVSTDLSCPDTPDNGEAGRRWPAGGDYHGLVALPDGRFRIMWADSRDGKYQLRTATVRVNGTMPRRQ